jgi:glycosyltransferase involved in cell wall biosynthesis
MNVLHINTLDNVGGAARAMYRLHQALRRMGHQSRLLVERQTVREPGIDDIKRQAKPFRTLADKLLDRVGPWLEKRWGIERWSHRNAWHIPQTAAFQWADVVNLHNLHGGYFNFRALPELARRKPIVWTLHDMWALTGGCAYAYHCEQWRDGCGDCPLLQGKGRELIEPKPAPPVDRTHSIWEAKRRTYRQAPLHIVTPSDWLRGLVEESILEVAPTIQWIPNGLDLAIFRPLDVEVARKALDLPLEAPIVFFSASGVANKRKGFDYLVEALGRLPDKGSTWLLTTGHRGMPDERLEGFKVRQLGHLDDERLQRLAFTAADLFVLPTLADNQPLVVVEALACGTPVVGFDVGGVPEMVRPGVTGLLAPVKDVEALRDAIVEILENPALREEMSENCRRIAVEEYALETQARRYAALYEMVLGNAAPP